MRHASRANETSLTVGEFLELRDGGERRDGDFAAARQLDLR